jgi:hypothetical protein
MAQYNKINSKIYNNFPYLRKIIVSLNHFTHTLRRYLNYNEYMDDKISLNLILLTYKGKALLMYRSDSAIDDKQHDWSFIGERNSMGKSTKEAIKKRVEKETGIRVEKVEYLSDSFYYTQLTDDDVNNIKRDECQLLDFFTLNDIQKLQLSYQTKQFVQKYGNLI